ncbi:MAG TPA: phage baseplate assembly protein V [Gemmatimonadales bacterium]|nr:phage baseplate assembly protein V [Gemmatimonadales bacterium]
MAGLIKGLSRGVITDVQDPMGKGRVSIRFTMNMPTMAGGWARVCTPFGAAASNAMPKVGDVVIVGFENDDINFPVVLGKTST